MRLENRTRFAHHLYRRGNAVGGSGGLSGRGSGGPAPPPAGAAPAAHAGPDGHRLPASGRPPRGRGEPVDSRDVTKSTDTATRRRFPRRRGPASRGITYAGVPQLPCDTFRKQSDSSCANNTGITETKTNNVTHAGTPRRVWTGWRGRLEGRPQVSGRPARRVPRPDPQHPLTALPQAAARGVPGSGGAGPRTTHLPLGG